MFHDSLLQSIQPSSPSFKRWREVPLRLLLIAALVGAIIGWTAASLPSSSIGLYQSVAPPSETEHLEVNQPPARTTPAGIPGGDAAFKVQLGSCEAELNELKRALRDVDISSRATKPLHQRLFTQNVTDH